MTFKIKLIFFAISSFIILFFVFGLYFYKFALLGLSNNQELWGQFGDFIGGTLNPILAFLSFMALLYTIKIQTEELGLSRKELEETKEELKESRIAQQEQSKSLKLQNQATKLQMFENTFYNLLSQHNSILEKLNYIDKIDIKFKEILGDLSSSDLTYVDICDKFKVRNKGIIKIYFMTLFQLLKFIDTKSKKLPIDANLYTNIIRATLDDKILVLLALNSDINQYTKYQELIIKYSFFEHLDFNSSYDLNNNVKNIVDGIIRKYTPKTKTSQNSAFVKAE